MVWPARAHGAISAGGGEGVRLRLPAAELAVLLRLMGGAGPAAAGQPGGAGEPAGALAARESLRARRLIARGDDGGLRIDGVALALVGTCLRPAARLQVVARAAAKGRREWLIHYLAALAVEQHVDTDGAHHFTAYASPPALVRRLTVLAGVGRRPRPAGEAVRLPGGAVVAAVEISGPTSRVSLSDVERLGGTGAGRRRRAQRRSGSAARAPLQLSGASG